MHNKDKRPATPIMTDYALDTIIERLRRDGEPPGWLGKLSPTFIPRPTGAEEHRENFQRYITGYPWIVIAADRGGNLRYHCAICWKVATMTHILTDHHIERACHNFKESLGQSMPVWMARFQSVDTSKGNLFHADGCDIWPSVCGECNANLLDLSAPRCSFCLPAARQQPANAGDDHDDALLADTGKRFRPSDTSKGAGSAHTDVAKRLVRRNECRDIREQGQARGSGQTGTRREPPPIGDGQEPFGRRQPRREADSRSALVRARCPDEPRLRKGYVRDLEKYVREHMRLFSMDHFFPYGPWSTDFTHCQYFLEALYKSSRETTSMGVHIKQNGAGSLVISPARRWGIRPQVDEWAVISRTHPTMDKIASGIVAKVSNGSFHIEWKAQWGRFDEFAAKVQPEDKRCPSEHFRVDMEIEGISTVRRTGTAQTHRSSRCGRT